jgi:hypothetical protein
MTEKIAPPWDPETVDALNAYQAEAPMHPFTCPHRDAGHPVLVQDRDRGVLTATEKGWVCQDCDYRQGWAWPWMADNSWWKQES